MFNGSPFFVRFESGRRLLSGGPWWMLMAPGLALIALALAILIWPELLAYLVASAILFAGIMLTLWGWSVRRALRRAPRQDQVYYEVL
jgi:hypothetical protein